VDFFQFRRFFNNKSAIFRDLTRQICNISPIYRKFPTHNTKPSFPQIRHAEQGYFRFSFCLSIRPSDKTARQHAFVFSLIHLIIFKEQISVMSVFLSTLTTPMPALNSSEPSSKASTKERLHCLGTPAKTSKNLANIYISHKLLTKQHNRFLSGILRHTAVVRCGKSPIIPFLSNL
jgi:hypothetical protein